MTDDDKSESMMGVQVYKSESMRLMIRVSMKSMKDDDKSESMTDDDKSESMMGVQE